MNSLDIDDTCDAVHGHQQLSLFNAHYDNHCFLPVHAYHVDSGKPVAVPLRGVGRARGTCGRCATQYGPNAGARWKAACTAADADTISYRDD